MRVSRKGILSAAAVLGLTAAGFIVLRQNRAQEVSVRDFFAMDTFFSLKAYGPGGEEALEQAQEKVGELEQVFSVMVEGSDVWRVNHAARQSAEHAAEGTAVTVGPDVLSVVGTALQLGAETGGALDITIYPVLREWGFTGDVFRVPEAERLKRLLERVDYRQVEIDREKSAVCVPEGVQIDLGSLAKGYTGDCLTELLRQEGVVSAILDLGGNVQTLGRKPDGSLWQVAVRNPFDAGGVLGVLEIEDKAVVTSGSYERYFTGEDGRDYWHILDPADGYPADNGLVSVTVAGESGILCDGLSTALFVMGRDKAISYWREKQDFDMILVTDEGKLYITEGLAAYFQSGDGWSEEIITASE